MMKPQTARKITESSYHDQLAKIEKIITTAAESGKFSVYIETQSLFDQVQTKTEIFVKSKALIDILEKVGYTIASGYTPVMVHRLTISW